MVITADDLKFGSVYFLTCLPPVSCTSYQKARFTGGQAMDKIFRWVWEYSALVFRIYASKIRTIQFIDHFFYTNVWPWAAPGAAMVEILSSISGPRTTWHVLSTRPDAQGPYRAYVLCIPGATSIGEYGPMSLTLTPIRDILSQAGCG
jgi:hypothetical protein